MIRLGPFEFAPVQPEPLPDFINVLRLARLSGLNFLRVPIDEDTDANYLAQYINPLINEHLRGKAREAIAEYNKNLDDQEKRRVALAVFTILKLNFEAAEEIVPAAMTTSGIGTTPGGPPMAPTPATSPVTPK